MSGGITLVKQAKAWASGLIVSAAVGVSGAHSTDMTAGVILDKMPVRERTAYFMGIVEGLAYARFRKDTVALGSKDEAGMKCIYDWFYEDSVAAYDRIEAVFRKYPEHFPSTLLAAMIKQECGE